MGVTPADDTIHNDFYITAIQPIYWKTVGTGNHLGLSGISAYTATGRIESFVNSIENSSADTISIFVAQNIGSQKSERTKNVFLKNCNF